MAGPNKHQRYARARERLPIRLTMRDGKREFEATIHSADISVSGIFLASEFFLKVGTELDLEFTMPNDDRVVRTRGVIVREVRMNQGGGSDSVGGFAMRFIDYYADAKTILASSFLVVELDDFIEDFLNRRTRRPVSEQEQLKEVLVAWEVGKMDLSGGEEDLIRGRLKVDKTGKIRRRDDRSLRIGMPARKASRSNAQPAQATARRSTTQRTKPKSEDKAKARGASKNVAKRPNKSKSKKKKGRR